MVKQRLYLKQEGSLLLGLCSGLGESFGINPWILRAVFLGTTAFGGFGLLIYALTVVSLSRKDSPKYNKRKIFGFCFYLNQRYKLDMSICRVVMTYFIVMTGIVPGLITYAFLSITMPKLFR